MKRLLLKAALISMFASGTAYAQWAFDGAMGLRQVRMSELDRNRRELVNEHGLLPGIELQTIYGGKDWSIGLTGEFYASTIAYDGHVQSGAPFSTDTKTRQLRIRIESAHRITATTALIAGIERDYWKRHILGRGATLGMDERYSSWRFLAGGETRIFQALWGDVKLKGLVVASSPEKLEVRFENQLFDQANLTTKSALGARLILGTQLRSVPNMNIETNFEWMRIDRSDDATLRKNSIPVGLLAQPEHVRKAFGVKLGYRF